MRDALAGAACVYHLAAQAGVRASWGSSFRTYTDDNVLATQAVLEACADLGVPRVVCASSSSVYGDVTEMPLREDGPCRPVSPYGVTKLACEHLCRLYATGRGLHTVALRFFTVFGPRQRPDMAFNLFMRAMQAGEPITVYGGGEQTRDFTYVDDIVAGIVARPAAPAGSVVNLGGGHHVSLLEALDTLADVTGIAPQIVQMSAQRGRCPRHLGESRSGEGAARLRADNGIGGGPRRRVGVAAQYAPRRLSTAGTVCSSSLMSQLRLQPVTYM